MPGRIEIIAGGFASPYAEEGTGLVRVSGCLYDAEGQKRALSERFSGYKGDSIANANPDRLPPPEDAETLPGTSLYLGHYMGPHYGHFLLETLSTFWVFGEDPVPAFDRVVFHPFVFGTARPAYVRFCFERFGLDPDRMVLVGARPLRFERAVLPERLLRLNLSADPALGAVYRRIATGAPPGDRPRRVYLSRRRITARSLRRAVANEARIEAIFRRHGYAVAYPEEMAFPDQVGLYAGAEAVAGLSGSALHNSVFMPEGALLIELGDPRYGGERAPAQMLCDRLAGVRSRFIPFRGAVLRKRMMMVFDTAHLEAALAGAEPPGLRGRLRFWRSLLDGETLGLVAKMGLASLRRGFGRLAGPARLRPGGRRPR